jgi:hypothetical protein
MKKPHRNPWGVICAILEAGFRVILIWICINIALLVVAVAVGIAVWMGHGFLPGLGSGMAAFVIGQAIALLIIDMTFQLPERREFAPPLPSDKEVLDALRAELESEAEQDVHGNTH